MPTDPARRSLRARSGPVPALRATADEQRAASLVVCARASDVSEARDLLAMLGLVALPAPIAEPAPSKCGSDAGHQAHRRRGEEPCESCRDAMRAKARERRHRDRARRELAQVGAA